MRDEQVTGTRSFVGLAFRAMIFAPAIASAQAAPGAPQVAAPTAAPAAAASPAPPTAAPAAAAEPAPAVSETGAAPAQPAQRDPLATPPLPAENEAGAPHSGYYQPVEPPPPPPAEGPRVRAPWEVFIGIGSGGALCGDEDESNCATEGGGNFHLGGAWRFQPNFAGGLELAAWELYPRDNWRGGLAEGYKLETVEVGAGHISVFGRWYWFKDGVDPFLHFGFGAGGIGAELEGELEPVAGPTLTDNYKLRTAAVSLHLGIGIEWELSSVFRLGGQYQASFYRGTEICETFGSEPEVCRDPRDPGDVVDGVKVDHHEGDALLSRLAIVGTFTFGRD